MISIPVIPRDLSRFRTDEKEAGALRRWGETPAVPSRTFYFCKFIAIVPSANELPLLTRSGYSGCQTSAKQL
jgi:hypothetical protein